MLASYIDSPEYRYFVNKVKNLSNLDLSNYKPWQIQRRLIFIMEQAGTKDYKEFADILASDNNMLNKFIDWVTINVSEFFRDHLKFKELKDYVLPELLRDKQSLKVWSAGCSNGSEPYTIALLLEELTPARRHTIIGTDLDNRILEQARAGRYQGKDIRNIPDHLSKRFLTQEGDTFVLSDEIKKRVTLVKHDLLRDPYDHGFDLILCRNVVIYFTNEAKDKIYRNFRESLNDGGVLFVGGAESILNARELGFQVLRPFFYTKLANSGGLDVKRVS